MNDWLNALDVQLPQVIVALILVTAVLSVGLIARRIVWSSPVARHAVMLWSLIGAGLCPLLIGAVRFAAIPPSFAIRKIQRLNILLGDPGAGHALRSGGQPATVHHLSLGIAFIVLWAAGSMFSTLGLVRGLRMSRRIRRGAQPLSAERIVPVRTCLLAAFGPKLPTFFLSSRVHIPMTTGYWRPIVLLPSSLMSQIDDQQLLQVLTHECAHALRSDALVALYQRTLAAIFWFHPLVHLANRSLDDAREEICDNYVLNIVPAREYANTLLTIAESVSSVRNDCFASALIQSASLETRIGNLLNPRRCIMTKLTARKVAAIAICFSGGVIVLSGFAGAPAGLQDSSGDFSHVVNLEGTGDNIRIVEVRGPSDTLSVGNTYQVRGTYRLVSQDKAVLAVNVTAEAGQPHEPHAGPLPRQQVIVEKGEGTFTLQFHLWHEGRPHVSFYPINGGDSLADRNF
jgi:beta-lactamase regulating signal transducer with metallopeptidase domain